MPSPVVVLLLLICFCDTFRFKKTIAAVISSNEHRQEYTTPNSVRNLVAEPDFRAIRLKWIFEFQPGLIGFDIRYCELNNWQTKGRCKEQMVPLIITTTTNESTIGLDFDEPVIRLEANGADEFEALISNLRMLTNYGITVQPNFGEVNSQFGDHKQRVDFANLQSSYVLVETKSFAAKTTRCLANSSNIEVQTGPYFRGKISVENSNQPACATYGNRSSNQSVYVLTINHELCGSKRTNNSRIETMVIVHENKEILTHNSRRFVVVCTFNPEVYSLTASVAVPGHLLKKYFNRIREKQFQITLRNVGGNLNSSQNTFASPSSTTAIIASTNKSGKTKRFSPRRVNEEMSSYQSNHSHLRDSRMLAEESGANWLKQQSGEENSVNLDKFPEFGTKLSMWLSLLANKLALAMLILLAFVIGSCLFILTAKKRTYYTRELTVKTTQRCKLAEKPQQSNEPVTISSSCH